MKKSMYREMYNMPPLEEKPKVKEETQEVEEKEVKKEVKKKNGRKFII